MNRVKRILQWRHIVLMVLLFQLFLAVAVQSQELETLTLTAKGRNHLVEKTSEWQKLSRAMGLVLGVVDSPELGSEEA